MKKYLFLTLILGIFYNSKAEELLGTIISYKAIKPNEYRVVYKVYSDILPDNRYYDFTKLKPFTFKVISGKNTVLNFPKFVKSDTVNKNVFYPNRGLVTYIYEDTIDLNDSKYSTIMNSGDCKIYFCFYYPERYSTLANIGKSSYFTYSYTNICVSSSNNSPKGEDYYCNKVANKKPTMLSFGFADTSDFDSLSYTFTTPKYGFDSTINFISGYSALKQIDADTFGINEFFGEIYILPNSENKNYGYSYEVAEFRKIGGKYLETGRVYVDLVVKVVSYNNNPPVLNGPYSYTVEAGNKLCFSIATDDKPIIPPPPQYGEPSDTVSLTWNRGIPGGTFSLKDTKARLKTGVFCWTPKLEDVNELPYYFTVTAYDNFWLRKEYTTKTYKVKVVEPVLSVSGVNKNKISIMPNPSSGDILKITGFAIEEVQIVSTTGKLVSKNKITPTNETEQNIAYLSPGIYIIQVQANGSFYRVKLVKN